VLCLANTRGIGDREFKTLGVIGEPEVSKRVIKGRFFLSSCVSSVAYSRLHLGEDWAFAVLFSDGISDVMSDQEVVDLCRGISDPTRAAAKVSREAINQSFLSTESVFSAHRSSVLLKMLERKLILSQLSMTSVDHSSVDL
jgi:serine/threonine protein phosphatase PrpC